MNVRLPLLIGLAGLAVLPGCALLDPTGAKSRKLESFAPPTEAWRTSVGQVQYATPERTLVGDAIVSRYGSDQFQFDFLLGPGVPALRLRIDGERAAAEGLLARGSWSGKTGKPGRMAKWVALRDLFAAVDTGNPPPDVTVVYAKGGRRIERLVVPLSETERLTFAFGR